MVIQVVIQVWLYGYGCKGVRFYSRHMLYGFIVDSCLVVQEFYGFIFDTCLVVRELCFIVDSCLVVWELCFIVDSCLFTIIHIAVELSKCSTPVTTHLAV